MFLSCFFLYTLKQLLLVIRLWVWMVMREPHRMTVTSFSILLQHSEWKRGEETYNWHLLLSQYDANKQRFSKISSSLQSVHPSCHPVPAICHLSALLWANLLRLTPSCLSALCFSTPLGRTQQAGTRGFNMCGMWETIYTEHMFNNG